MKLTRTFYLVAACTICLINGPVVMNWQPVLEMLTKSGVYGWLCEHGVSDCADRRKALAFLGTLGQTMMFVGSVLGGLVTDTFGPRKGLCLGCILFAIHYLTLAIASESVQLYIPSYIIHGFAIEMTFFGVLGVSNLFPGRQQFTLSIMGTFRSLAMAYAILQELLSRDKVLGIRLASFLFMVVSLSVGVFGFFFFPDKPFGAEDDNKVAALALATEESRILEHERGNLDRHGAGRENSWHRLGNELDIRHDNPQELNTSVSLTNSSIALDNMAVVVHSEELSTQPFKLFLKIAIKPLFIIWVAYFSGAYARGVFYTLSLNDQHPEITKAFSILGPLSFIPCPFLGYLADVRSIFTVLLILNTCGAILYICLLSGDSPAAQWIGALCSWIVLSFLASQNYCFVASQYPAAYYGKLAGTGMLMAGLVGNKILLIFSQTGFVNTPLYNWGVDSKKFFGPNMVYMCFSGVGFLLIWCLRANKTTSITK